MGIYVYKGIDRQGKNVKSSISSENINQAKQKIKSMGIFLMEIAEQTSQSKSAASTITFGSGVGIADLSLMTRQLSTLVKAKIQIVEALNALVDQTENQKLKVVLSEVKQKVNEGISLAKALNDYPKIFNNVYVNMVEAGETSGTLDLVLLRLAEFTEAQTKLANKIKGALYYPVAMASFGSLLIMVIFVKVIPQLAKMFKSNKIELPLQTKICLAISNFLQNYWYLAIIAPPIIFYLIKTYLNTTAGRERWHQLQLKLPVVGPLTRMINVGRFSSTLGTLLTSGVPILTAMSIVKNLIPNTFMQRAVEEARSSISEGGSMTGPLIRSGHFPPMMTHMVKLGERSGELEPMLQIVAETYDDQVENKLNGLSSILEPIMMIVLGLVVAFIVASVIVPLMEINKVR